MYQTKAAMSTRRHGIVRAERGKVGTCGGRSGGFWRQCSNLRHMAHLAARPRRPFAVEVDGRARDGQPLLIAVDFVPDQIGHGDRAMTDRLAERPPADAPGLLFDPRPPPPAHPPSPP